jgi:hypothetical protein
MPGCLRRRSCFEGFVHLVSLNGILHVIPAETSDGHVAVVFHVFVLLAEDLDVGLGVLTTKGEGNEELVVKVKMSAGYKVKR